jgi:hypothetical protein
MAKTPYPDEVTVVSETQGGSVQMNLLNWASHFGESRVELYGEKGTVVYKQRGDVILAAQAGQEQLQPRTWTTWRPPTGLLLKAAGLTSANG